MSLYLLKVSLLSTLSSVSSCRNASSDIDVDFIQYFI